MSIVLYQPTNDTVYTYRFFWFYNFTSDEKIVHVGFKMYRRGKKTELK